MKRCTAVILLILGSSLCYGADFWEKTKFPDWSQKDAEKLLKDSPWADKAAIVVDKQGADDSSGVHLAEVVIRWNSALPIKQAVAKMNFGDKAGTDPQAQATINRQYSYIIIGVINVPDSIAKAGAASFKEDAMLRRKNKEPIPASDVQASAGSLYFIFPKTGVNEITVDDEEVELILKLGSTVVRKKWKVKDMVYEGKLEM